MTSEPEAATDETDAEAPEERTLPALAEAQRAFDVGDFRRVRTLLEPLLADSDEAVRAAAQVLRHRVSVDPFQVGLLLVCLAIFVYISWHYLF